MCVQEVTLAGALVRTVGGGVLDCDAKGIAASADLIAISTPGGSKKVWLFDFVSGRLIRVFGEHGHAVGQLYATRGLRFTPDGGHLIIAEDSPNSRLSFFTLTGVFVRCMGVGTLRHPFDVEFAPNGDVVVADYANRIVVFSPDGYTLLRSFGGEGEEPGKFKSPAALAMHGGQLFVLEAYCNRVQVFN